MPSGSASTRALVVEDDLNIVDLIRSNLSVRGYDTVVSTDGIRALQLLETESPDIVLLDLMLPEVDGFELCRQIRERSAVAIIVVSARGGERDKVTALNMGADDYMTKPFSIIVMLYTVLTGRTRFGRYIYAIGGNAEAARRAGVNLIMIRTLAFTLCGLTVGIGGILLASQLNSIGTTLNGGQYVLFAVAAAVIGGTNLFGGRGRMLHAVLGGLVVATIDNGLALIGLTAAATNIITAIVLLAAVTIDTVARRSRATSYPGLATQAARLAAGRNSRYGRLVMQVTRAPGSV